MFFVINNLDNEMVSGGYIDGKDPFTKNNCFS